MPKTKNEIVEEVRELLVEARNLTLNDRWEMSREIKALLEKELTDIIVVDDPLSLDKPPGNFHTYIQTVIQRSKKS